MLKFAFFDAKQYDRPSFETYGKEADVHFHFFETRLTADAAALARGYDGVCVFVNDAVNADVIDIDEKTIFRATEGLGRGVGGLGGTCGALLGAASVAGMLTSDGEMHDPPTKKRSHELAAAIFEAFEAECGSSVCRELRGIGSGVVLTPCDECIAAAARIAERVLLA